MVDIEQRAAELVASTDGGAIAALIAEFPEPDKIGLRTRWLDLNPHEQRLPACGHAREAYLKARIAHFDAEHLGNVSRYSQLRTQGLAALSAYDLCVAGCGDALGALRCALRLTSAHVSYSLSLLVRLSLELDNTRAELAGDSAAQIALF